jgi:hypothetical protein
MDKLVLIDKTKDTGRYTTLTYKDAAAVMTLDLADLESSIAEHGRCDTEFYICVPLEPPKKET